MTDTTPTYIPMTQTFNSAVAANRPPVLTWDSSPQDVRKKQNPTPQGGPHAQVPRG
jgi:hypothetical protein